jgi:hypothetical protein
MGLTSLDRVTKPIANGIIIAVLFAAAGLVAVLVVATQ